MSAAEVNFTFNGLHCLRDFGCIFIEDRKRIISPETERGEYEIAGVSGTVLMNDQSVHKPYTLSGTLVPMTTPATMRAGQQLAREIAAWLKAGRRTLIWDYEPMHRHDAEVEAAIKWDTSVWIDGGIAVTFKVQPYTRSIYPATACKEMAAGGDTLFVPVETTDPCPVSLQIVNTGDSPITSAKVTTPGGKTVELAKGLSLAVGATLALDMEPPIGAAIIQDGTRANALRYAVQFDPLTLDRPGSLSVILSGPAQVSATAWGYVL